MKVKRIEIMKDQLKPKSVYNIQVFLNFAKFYWQFIKSQSRIATLFILILKTIRLFDISIFGKNDGNDIIIGFNSDNKKLDKKLEKLSKSRKSKSKKLPKSQKLARLRKKSSKIGKTPKKVEQVRKAKVKHSKSQNNIKKVLHY